MRPPLAARVASIALAHATSAPARPHAAAGAVATRALAASGVPSSARGATTSTYASTRSGVCDVARRRWKDLFTRLRVGLAFVFLSSPREEKALETATASAHSRSPCALATLAKAPACVARSRCRTSAHDHRRSSRLRAGSISCGLSDAALSSRAANALRNAGECVSAASTARASATREGLSSCSRRLAKTTETSAAEASASASSPAAAASHTPLHASRRSASDRLDAPAMSASIVAARGDVILPRDTTRQMIAEGLGTAADSRGRRFIDRRAR